MLLDRLIVWSYSVTAGVVGGLSFYAFAARVAHRSMLVIAPLIATGCAILASLLVRRIVRALSAKKNETKTVQRLKPFVQALLLSIPIEVAALFAYAALEAPAGTWYLIMVGFLATVSVIGVRLIDHPGVSRHLLGLGQATPTDDLEGRLHRINARLSSATNELAGVQTEILARTETAAKLAAEVERYRLAAEEHRAAAEDQQRAIKAVESLLHVRLEGIARSLDRHSRRSQWLFLAAGAFLGWGLQVVWDMFLRLTGR